MSDPLAHLNTALTGRYSIERKLGEGGTRTRRGNVQLDLRQRAGLHQP